jgi:cytochrome c biogenesis protein CcmG, thiol:disulfide interchange protein DsbE
MFTLPSFSDEPPTFNLPTQNERMISLDSLKGEVVYLDFWASWCKPCRDTFPWMNEIREKYQSRGLKVIAVNLDHKRDLADKFLTEHPANFTIAFDPEGKTAADYKVAAMPTAFIIDRSGKIIERHEGFHAKDREKLLQLLEQTLSDTSNVGVSR